MLINVPGSIYFYDGNGVIQGLVGDHGQLVPLAGGGVKVTQGQGDQYLYGSDGSPLRMGSWTTASGGIYTTVGDIVMYYWTHNVALDASGNFLGRDDAGPCTLYAITEGIGTASPQLRVYNAVTGAAASTPTWTLMRVDDLGTGLTYDLTKSVVATASLTAATLSAKYTYFTGAAGASFAVTLPAAAAAIDGLMMTLMSSAARASTTWVSTGATFVGAPTSLTAGVPVKLQYDHASLAWYVTA